MGEVVQEYQTCNILYCMYVLHYTIFQYSVKVSRVEIITNSSNEKSGKEIFLLYNFGLVFCNVVL